MNATFAKLVFIPICFVLANAMAIWGRLHAEYHILIFVAFVPTTVAMVSWLWLLHEMGSGLQDGYARTTALQAVLLMCLPIFNLYWLFQVVWGFATDFNTYCLRHKLTVKPLNTKLFWCFCFLVVASVVPYLGFLISFLSMVVFCFLIPHILRALRCLRAHSLEVQRS